MRRIPSTTERTLSDIEVFVQSALTKFKTEFVDASVGFFRSHHYAAAPEKEAVALLSPLLEAVRAAQDVSVCDIEPKSEIESTPCSTPAQFF